MRATILDLCQITVAIALNINNRAPTSAVALRGSWVLGPILFLSSSSGPADTTKVKTKSRNIYRCRESFSSFSMMRLENLTTD